MTVTDPCYRLLRLLLLPVPGVPERQASGRELLPLLDPDLLLPLRLADAAPRQGQGQVRHRRQLLRGRALLLPLRGLRKLPDRQRDRFPRLDGDRQQRDSYPGSGWKLRSQFLWHVKK